MSELLFTQSLIKQENSISVLCGGWFRDDFVTRLRPAPGSSRSRRSVGGQALVYLLAQLFCLLLKVAELLRNQSQVLRPRIW